MKQKLFSVMVAVLLTMTAAAQKNPKPGYILANEGKTVHGTIDYLSGEKNAKGCMFRPDGSGQFAYLRADQIEGFRLDDSSVYYVRKTFPINNEQKTFLAEFLLEGEVSLYRHEEKGEEYFILEDIAGRVAVLTNLNYEKLRMEDAISEKQLMMSAVSQVLHQDPALVNRLADMKYEAAPLTRLVRAYNERYCRSYGDCVTYLFEEKAAAAMEVHPRVEAGVAFGKFSGSFSSLNAVAPQVAVGMDLLFPRYVKGLSLQAMLLLSMWNKERGDWKEDFELWDFHVGAAYQFLPERKFSPVVRAGYANRLSHNYSRTAYVGGGVDMKVGKYHAEIMADYQFKETNLTVFSVVAAFRF